MTGWEKKFLETSYQIHPKSDGGDTISDLRYYIEKALETLDGVGTSNIFELIQVEVKLKESIGWMDALK